MEFRQQSRANYLQHKKLLFQKVAVSIIYYLLHLINYIKENIQHFHISQNLIHYIKIQKLSFRNEIFAISDQDITFEKVEELTNDMKKNRKYLFQKSEDIIELGTLQIWALKFAQQSINSFMECVNKHDYSSREKYEDDLFNKINLLSEIQILFTKERYRNSPAAEASLSQELLQGLNSIFSVVLYAENWKINYVSCKYMYSLIRHTNYFDSNEAIKINKLVKNFSQHQNCIVKNMREINSHLTIAHFLPEFFDYDQITNSLKDWKFENKNAIFNKINKYQEKEKQQKDFIINDFVKANIKDLNSEILSESQMDEIVLKKLGQTKNSFEGMTYLLLAFFYMHQSLYDGYEFDHSNYYNSDQVNVIIHSIYFIKHDVLKDKKNFFIDFFIPEILSTNISYYVNLHFHQTKDLNHITRFIENIVKPNNKLEDINYIFDIIEGLKVVIQKNENLFSIFEILESENNPQQDTITVAKKMFDEFVEMIIDASINNKNYSNILLVSSLCGKEFVKPKIAKIMIYLFELQERDEILDSQNLQQTLSFNRMISNSLPEYIYKEVAQSKMEYFIDYLYLHYIEKECPYGTFFIKHMCFHFDALNEFISLTTDTALKLFKIYKRYVNDFKNATFNHEGHFFEIINRISNKLQKEENYQTEYEECAALLMRQSFYYFNQQYFEKMTFLNNIDTQFPLYYKKFFYAEMQETYENEKNLILSQFKQYPHSNFAITRALVNYSVVKNNVFSQNLMQFFGHFYYYYKYSLSASIKITKENFQQMIRYDIENINPFCIVSRYVIQHYSFMSYFSIKNSELFDDTGKKLDNQNYVFAFLEFFEQFLKENFDILKKSTKKIKKQCQEKTQKAVIQYLSSQIHSEQDYNEVATCRKFTFLIQFGLSLFNRFDSYDLKQSKFEIQQDLIERLQSQILSLYDFKTFYEVIGSQNYEVLQQCDYEESTEYLNLFKKGKMSKIFCGINTKSNKTQEIDMFEQIPFSFIRKLIHFTSEKSFYPQVLNSLASLLITHNNTSTPCIQQICQSEDKINFEEFFKLSAYFNNVMKIFIKNMQNTQHQLLVLTEDEQSQSSKKKKNRREIKSEQTSKLFYLTDIDILIKDLIYYQEFILKLLKKENISIFVNQRSKINVFHNLFLEFIENFVDSSMNMIGTLLSLVHSQHPNYKRSSETIKLLNTLINNIYIIEIVQLSYGGEWRSNELSSQIEQFLDSFETVVDTFSELNMDFESLIKESQVLFNQFGNLISDNFNRVLNENSLEVDFTFQVFQKIIDIDIALKMAARKQELREQCRKEIVEEKQQNKLQQDKDEKIKEEKKDDKQIDEETKEQIKESDEKLKSNQEEEKKENICQEKSNDEQDKEKDQQENNKDKEDKEGNDKKEIDQKNKEDQLKKEIEKKVDEKLEQEKEKYEKEIEQQKQGILTILMKKIAIYLNVIFKKVAISQNKRYVINKDVKAILNLSAPNKPITTFGLNEFFNLCFIKLNKINPDNVIYFHQHLKRLILYIGKNDLFTKEMKNVPFIKASIEGNKLYADEFDDEEEYEELQLYESFTEIYDSLCSVFELLKKNYQNYLSLDKVLEVYLNLSSTIRQFSLSTSELQQIYDKSIEICQYIFDLKSRYKNEGVEIEMSQQYLLTIESLTEKIFITLKSLNNLVPNIRIESIESIIQNYLNFVYYKSNPWEDIKESILYFINVLFIVKGGANFKHFLRKSIVNDIVALKFPKIKEKNVDQGKLKYKKEQDNENENDDKSSQVSKRKSIIFGAGVGESNDKKENSDKKSGTDDESVKLKKKSKNVEQESDQESKSSTEDEESEDNLTILFDIQSFSNEYEIEIDENNEDLNQQNKNSQKQKKQEEEDENSGKKQKKKGSKDNIHEENKESENDEEDDDESEKDDDEDNNEEEDENESDEDEKSEGSLSCDEDKSDDDEEDEDNDDDDKEDINESEKLSKSEDSGREEDEDNVSSSSKSYSVKMKKKKNKNKEKQKKKKEQQRIQNNLENLKDLRISLTQIKKNILSKYLVICQSNSQILYEIINELFEVSKIKITQNKKESNNLETDKSKEKDEDNKSDKNDDNESRKDDKQKLSESENSNQNNNFDDLIIIGKKIDIPQNKDEIQQQDQNSIEEDDINIENKDGEEDDDKEDNQDKDSQNDSIDQDNNLSEKKQNENTKEEDDKNEEVVKEDQNESPKSKKEEDEKDNEKDKNDSEDEDEKESKSSSEDKDKNKVRRTILYKLRNPAVIKQLYENKDKLVKMTQGQKNLIQNLINVFIQKVNNINQEIKNINKSNQYKFFPKVEVTMYDYLDIETIQNYIISLIQNYESLILPSFDEFTVKDIQKDKNESLHFYDESKSQSKFFDYLIHITLTTNYESQELLSFIIFNSIQHKEQKISRTILRQVLYKTLSLLQNIVSQPDFLTNMKITFAFDGILNFFKNILNCIEDKKRQDGLLVLSVFQQAIHNANSMKEFDLLFYNEIFNIYQKAIQYIIDSIYGSKFNLSSELSFVKEHFLSYFAKDKIEESLKICKLDSKSILSTLSEDEQHKKIFQIEWEFEDEQYILQQYPTDDSQQFNIFKEIKNNYFLYLVVKNQKPFKQKSPPKAFEKNEITAFSSLFQHLNKMQGNKNVTLSEQFKVFDHLKHIKNIYNQTKLEIKPNNILFYQLNNYLHQQKIQKEQAKQILEQEKKKSETQISENKLETKTEINQIDEILEKEIEQQCSQIFTKNNFVKESLRTRNESDAKTPKVQYEEKEQDKQKEFKVDQENQSTNKKLEDEDEKDYVCPSNYGFESNALEKYSIDRKLYISLTPEERQTLLESKKSEFTKKEKDKKIRITREREKFLLSNIFGNKEDLEKSKQELKVYLNSKEFSTTVKQLEKEEQRLILLTQDNEYLKMLDNKMKKKANKFMKKQKISKKKKQKSSDKNNEKTEIFTNLKKIYKNTGQQKQKKKQNNIMKRINKSLQIPLIDEDVALKMVVCWISSSESAYKKYFNLIMESSFINPFNYMRILGLVIFIASKIINNSRFNIEWLDKIIYETKEKFLNQKPERSAENEEDNANSHRDYLLSRCTLMIQQLLLEKGYGLILLQFEEFVFGKEFDKVEYVRDKKSDLNSLKREVFEYNLLNESFLDLDMIEYKNLSFKHQFDIVTKNQNDCIKSLNEYIMAILNLSSDKKKLGFPSKQDNSEKPYGKVYIDFIDRENNQLIENTLELFCLVQSQIRFSNLKIDENPENIKNGIFRDKYESNLFNIVNLEEQIIIKHQSKKNTMPIVEQILKFIILYGKKIDHYSNLDLLIKYELYDYGRFLRISDLLLNEYGQQMKKVIDDVLPAMKQYKSLLKNKHNKDNLYENQQDDDGNDVNQNLKEPITTLLSNIYSFQQEYVHSYYKNLKIIIHCIDGILEQRMIQYYEEFQDRLKKNGKNDAFIWWNEKEFFQKQSLYDEIKVNWMEETKPLSTFYAQFFEFVHICLQLQQVTDNSIPSYYSDCELCLKSFLKIYNTFFIDKKKQDDSLDQDEIITIEDEIQMPAFKRIFTSIPNEMFEGEEEEMNIQEPKIRKYSQMLHKNYSAVNTEDLYDALKTKFVPLINRFMNNRKNNMWVVLMSELNQAEMSIENKFCYVKAIARKENKNRSNPDNYYEMNCEVDRDEIWYSIYKIISGLPPSSLVTEQFEINFKNEDGIDAGGLSREFYTRVFKDLLDPSKGFFCPSSNGITTQPSPYSNIIPDHLLHFKYAGRLVAKSILDNFSCEIDFTRSFLKQILGKDLYINDLEDIDPDMAKNLMWILDNDVSNLYLDFTYTHNDFGKQQIVELKPNGAHIEVKEENKKEYVKLLAQYRMVKLIEPQIKSFQHGFYEIIPYKAIKIFSVRELGFKLSGENKIDLEDLKQNINLYTYTKESDQIIWLFEILEEYTQEQRAGFLFFITGSFRVPFGGFQNFKLSVSKLSDTQSLPVAHTCSKEIELPSYETKQIMKEKLEIALMEGAKGFYIG